MKKKTSFQKLIHTPLIAVLIIVGLYAAFHLVLFSDLNPFPAGPMWLIDGKTPQQTVSAEELATWPTFTDERAGISLKYPPQLKQGGTSSYTIGRHEANPRGGESAMRYSTFFTGHEASVQDEPSRLFYDWSSCSLSDKLGITYETRQFKKENITALVNYWKNPMSVTVGGKEGYRVIFRDFDRAVDHYILPTNDGQIVRISFQACRKSKELVRPYKQMILSTVTFN